MTFPPMGPQRTEGIEVPCAQIRDEPFPHTGLLGFSGITLGLFRGKGTDSHVALEPIEIPPLIYAPPGDTAPALHLDEMPLPVIIRW